MSTQRSLFLWWEHCRTKRGCEACLLAVDWRIAGISSHHSCTTIAHISEGQSKGIQVVGDALLHGAMRKKPELPGHRRASRWQQQPPDSTNAAVGASQALRTGTDAARSAVRFTRHQHRLQNLIGKVFDNSGRMRQKQRVGSVALADRLQSIEILSDHHQLHDFFRGRAVDDFLKLFYRNLEPLDDGLPLIRSWTQFADCQMSADVGR